MTFSKKSFIFCTKRTEYIFKDLMIFIIFYYFWKCWKVKGYGKSLCIFISRQILCLLKNKNYIIIWSIFKDINNSFKFYKINKRLISFLGYQIKSAYIFIINNANNYYLKLNCSILLFYSLSRYNKFPVGHSSILITLPSPGWKVQELNLLNVVRARTGVWMYTYPSGPLAPPPGVCRHHH